MAFDLGHHIKETTATTGTGVFTLAAVAGYLRFASQIANGATVLYSRFNSTPDIEVGVGTFDSGAHTITPLHPSPALLYSTNGGALINWTGTQNVVCGIPSELFLYLLDPTGALGLVERTVAWPPAYAAVTVTAAGKALLDDANAAAQRTTLGSTTVGDAVFIAASAAAAQSAIGIANAFFTTGDVKLTLKAVADTGWVLCDDKSIGNAASGATGRANADTEALFTLLWTNVINTWAPVSGGRGASAAADFAANKTLTLPRTLGRALGIFGAGSGLTARVLGEYLGAETHTLTTAEMPAHTHPIDPLGNSTTNDGALAMGGNNPGTGDTDTDSTGGGGAHANMQPTSFLNAMIKL